MKDYGKNGKWTCTICGCSFTPDTIHKLDDKDKLIWTQAKAFFRDLETYQEPKCPHCHGEMTFQIAK